MKYGYLGSYDISRVHELPSKELLQERGLYVILNTVSHKIYVGKTDKSFKYRFDVHNYELCHKCHLNKHLQNSWNKYGSGVFIFCILIKLNNLYHLQKEHIRNETDPFFFNKRTQFKYG